MRQMLPLSLVLAIALSAPVFGQSEETRSAGDDSGQAARVAGVSYEKALKAYNAKDYAKAEKELETCLKRLPTYSEAHLLMSKSLYSRKEYAAALAEVQLAESTFEASATRLQQQHEERRSEMQRRKREVEEQIREITAALARPLSEEERRNLERQKSQYEQIRDDLQRKQFEPQVEAKGMPAEYAFFHGNVLLRLGRVDEAVTQYREALKRKPAYADASNNLAALFYSAKLPQKALEVIEEAAAVGVKVNPELEKAVREALAH